MVSVSELAFEFAKKIKQCDDLVKKSAIIDYKIEKSVVEIKSQRVSKILNREIGCYECLNCTDEIFLNKTAQKYVSTQIKKIILNFIKREGILKLERSLVIGLGNRHFASDSLGVKTVDKILVTRHAITQKLNLDKNLNNVSAFSTSVFGKTGIETAEIVKKIVEIVKPQVVVLIDTLATDDVKRLGKSFQITNTSIFPGGAVENKRVKIDKKFLNTPIIVAGIPLVVYADAFCKGKKSKNANGIVVTPKDIEEYVKTCSQILATGINLALHKNLNFKLLNEFF